MAKFQMNVTLEQDATRLTARVADGTGVSNQLTDADRFKLVKMKGDSQYGLCAAGDEIEGFLLALEPPMTYDGYYLGTVQTDKRFRAVSEGVLNMLGEVVCGTVTARGTALNGVGPAVKAGTPTTHRWRVVAAIGQNVAAGAPITAGSEVIVERI